MRLRRDLVGLPLGGPIGRAEAYLLFVGGLSLALSAVSAVGIVFTSIFLGQWLLSLQVRVELRDDCLVAGHKVHPMRLKWADPENAEIGKV
ncbi:MAG TPA: hypothetical protein ENI86_06860 [Acidimicrobiales bacterium]|nr:hypothetical protein [Acidimicrobiales bacterium]